MMPCNWPVSYSEATVPKALQRAYMSFSLCLFIYFPSLQFIKSIEFYSVGFLPHPLKTVICNPPGPLMFEKCKAWEVWAVLQAVGSTGVHCIAPYEPHPIFYMCPKTIPTV